MTDEAIKKLTWAICRLWFNHDMDVSTCRCRNCGVGLYNLVQTRPMPCIQGFLEMIQHRWLD